MILSVVFGTMSSLFVASPIAYIPVSYTHLDVYKRQVHYGTGKQKDYDYNARKKAQSDEIDRILDKLKKSGYESLKMCIRDSTCTKC